MQTERKHEEYKILNRNITDGCSRWNFCQLFDDSLTWAKSHLVNKFYKFIFYSFDLITVWSTFWFGFGGQRLLLLVFFCLSLSHIQKGWVGVHFDLLLLTALFMTIALAICAYAYLYRVLHSLTEHKKTGQSGKSSSAASSELSILPIVSLIKNFDQHEQMKKTQ